MRILLLFLLLSCSSFIKPDVSHDKESNYKKKISHQLISLDFKSDQIRLGNENEEKLREFAKKALHTPHLIKEITIFSNPNKLELLPKEMLLHYDRAFNAKRFLQKNLNSLDEIKISDKKESGVRHKKVKSDILILIEYL